ncbi:putative enoyl-CoA hydratase [Nocardia nova SH22a]|uniref:Putative enoyl-CoA hydratase n=1 Tax=Nocardia nova SH22a TaxID=1415166 RepID=W5TKW0_9NOCA|nr:enoyl-CoA hydratase-related protein [Nocardia nova]AHH19990.1 putative enoyl-CoA hydratase [Nocardia nova SH22a]
MAAVLVESHDHVLVVTINRPTAMNSVDAGVSAGVGEALELAENSQDVRAVVITGAGDRSFCAGADLKAVAAGTPITAPGRPEWGFAGYVRHPISKPTIAAVNGFALGGGTEIVLASDLAVCADTATLGLPEVARGLFAAAGGAFRLPAQIPRKVALELILTGDPSTAARAERLGLVNRVVAADQVLGTAIELADRIGRNAPLAVRAAKRVALGITSGQQPEEDTRWALSQAEMHRLRGTRDLVEGARAFAEKRQPRWEAR